MPKGKPNKKNQHRSNVRPDQNMPQSFSWPACASAFLRIATAALSISSSVWGRRRKMAKPALTSSITRRPTPSGPSSRFTQRSTIGCAAPQMSCFGSSARADALDLHHGLLKHYEFWPQMHAEQVRNVE